MSELAERLEILRRIGERGLMLAQLGANPGATHYPERRASADAHAKHVDLWQHLLDELKRVDTGDKL